MGPARAGDSQTLPLPSAGSDYAGGNGSDRAARLDFTHDTGIALSRPLIRQWRTKRRMSQLDLALEAEISQRHLSFVESGRARPSREMVLLLAERLGLPLRERNALLLASGFAPSFGERSVTDPSLSAAMQAVDAVLKGHEPHPASRSTETGRW